MQKRISTLTLVLTLLFLTSSLNAQITVSFGVKGGINASTVIGEDAERASALIGPHAGRIVRFSGDEDGGFMNYVIQPELFYSIQGAKGEERKITLSYLNLPIMIQRYIASSGFYIATGPQIGFLLSAKEKTSFGNYDIKSSSRPIDFSLAFGLGYLLNSGIGIDLHYSLGVTSYSKDYDEHNAVLSFGLFYTFIHLDTTANKCPARPFNFRSPGFCSHTGPCLYEARL